MSLHMNTGASRLTVLGTGWTDVPIDSGSGGTLEGELFKDIATDLEYDFGKNTDWDAVANNEYVMDWSKVVYETPDGTMYTDPDGDGVYTDPVSGLTYEGGGTRWVPKDVMMDVSDAISNVADADLEFEPYEIPEADLKDIYGGKVGTEITITRPDEGRPHLYSPDIWYIQERYDVAYIFLDEPFTHDTSQGGHLVVYDEAVTIRDGSTKTVYWSDCNTQFWDNYLPEQYDDIPIQYVCWQCLYGPLEDELIKKTERTVTTEDIENDDTDLKTKKYGGVTYYARTKGGMY